MFAKAAIEVFRIKQHVSLQRLVVHWGNIVDYKAVQPEAVCSQGIQTLLFVCLRSLERLHIVCASVCAFEHCVPVSSLNTKKNTFLLIRGKKAIR